MFSLSKVCHHPPGIPRGALFKSPLSWISSAPGSLNLGPYPEILSIEVLVPCGFHSLGFTSPDSICSGGNHHGFSPKSKSDTSRPHSSNCCFVNLSTLSPRAWTLLFQSYHRCFLSPECHAFPNLHGFWHWKCQPLTPCLHRECQPSCLFKDKWKLYHFQTPGSLYLPRQI